LNFFPGRALVTRGFGSVALQTLLLSLFGAFRRPVQARLSFMSIQSVLRVAQVKDFMKQDQGGSPRLVLPARPSFKGGRGPMRIPEAVRRHAIG